MSNHNKMGNVSRAANEIKKKLELSFMQTKPEVEESAPVIIKKQTQAKENNKHIATELKKDAGSGNRYKKVVPRSAGAVKAKATFCLDTIALEQLNAVYIKRLSTMQKSDRSSLICEAISLLFEQEK